MVVHGASAEGDSGVGREAEGWSCRRHELLGRMPNKRGLGPERGRGTGRTSGVTVGSRNAQPLAPMFSWLLGQLAGVACGRLRQQGQRRCETKQTNRIAVRNKFCLGFGAR